MGLIIIRVTLLVLLVVPVTLFAHCLEYRGRIESLQTTSDCDSPFGLCTAGKITEGVLKGTTRYTVTKVLGVVDQHGPTALPTFVYAGNLKVTTKYKGTLEIEEAGMWDQEDKLDSGQAKRIVGTGKFLGSTGELFFYGNSLVSNNVPGFKERISGKICLSREAEEIEID